MRIGFYGNCQCQAIESLFAQIGIKSGLEVILLPPVFKCEDHMLEDMRKRIGSIDMLFSQFISERFGYFSTQELSKYVTGKICFIPNLQCNGYSPQMTEPLSVVTMAPPIYGGLKRMINTDFRVLELYLKGLSKSDAAHQYYDVNVDKTRLQTIFFQEIAKQRNLFKQGLISFDFAERLESRYSEHLLFWTYNHPAKSEIEWLINSILKFLGQNITLSVNMEVLGFYRPPYIPNILSEISPSLVISSPIIVMGRILSIDDYVAGFYEDFREHDYKSLTFAYENSLWRSLTSEHSSQDTPSSLNLTRKQIAEFWLNVPSDPLVTAYQSELGDLHRKLMESNLRNEPLSEEDKVFFQHITSELTRRSSVDPVSAINYLLAAMLYLPADRLKIENARASLPQWLIGDYERFFRH